MNNLCKALMVALGSVIVYTVTTKVAVKICEQPDQDDIEDIAEELMDELEDDFDEEVVENIFHRIGKEIKEYMRQATNASKERLELCLDFVTNDKNRRVVGVIVATLGIGIFASSYIN